MSNYTDTKKKLSFFKIILWILGIVVVLQLISGGEFLEDVFEAYQSDKQSNPTSPTEIASKAYIGISGRDTENNAGALVTFVAADSPAKKAGIQKGDIITAIGSLSITNSSDFKLAIAAYNPRDTVEISLIRGGVVMTLNVVFEEKTETITYPQQEATQPRETQKATLPPTLPRETQKVTNPPTRPQNTTTQPQSTKPLQSNTQPHKGNTSLPTELREHILVGGRDSGICATFTGNVLITVIFVNDPTSTWTAEKIATTKAGDAAMTAKILSEAASYGANLNIKIEYRQATVNITEESDAKAWSEQIVSNAGLGSISTASAELERTRAVKEAPILFYVNATERSYAMPYTSGSTEYAVIWNCGSDTITYRHELYHLFGAADYYSPVAVMECAKRYWPNSTMLTGENAVTDDLTAYMIGWTDIPSNKALSFLRETAHVKPEDAALEFEKETHTGYVENWEKNGTYITGYLDFGILEGQGKVVYADGSWKEGYFEYGNLIRGRSKIIYPNGSWYEGDIADGTITGQGTIVWSNGDTYTGQWKENQYHGNGKLIYANGSWREGVFENGVFVRGRGKIIYTDGSWYEGDIDQGEAITGQGTIVWSNGESHTGGFLNGKQHGYGTHKKADGTSVSGTWENGTYIR